MFIFLVPILSMGGIAAVLAAVLAVADSRLKVDEDIRIAEIHELLPGANCGACGLPGCHEFAEQVISGTQNVNNCLASSPEAAKAIADILGIEIEVKLPVKARVKCLGGTTECGRRAEYRGIQDCRAASMVAGGAKGCIYGCLGYGSCASACPFGAITMSENSLPVIDDKICTGCGICVDACPRGLMAMVAEGTRVFAACGSLEKGKTVRQICAKGCIGCALCVKVCPRKAIDMENNLPVIDNAECDGCGICVEKCPTKSLVK